MLTSTCQLQELMSAMRYCSAKLVTAGYVCSGRRVLVLQSPAMHIALMNHTVYCSSQAKCVSVLSAITMHCML
jgi:hypothetical protein